MGVSSSTHRCASLLAQRRRVAVLVVSGVQLRTRPMGSRSDACRCDAEGYPHPMASTGAASLGVKKQWHPRVG